MLILHVGRSQMDATPNIYPPSPTTVFKAVKDTSLLYVFCYSFVPRDTHIKHGTLLSGIEEFKWN